MYQATKDLSDLEVIQKILSGEKACFEVLIRRNNASLYKVGRAFGFNHQDTEDLMQDAHVTAFMNLEKFEGRSQYKTWVVKIMVNKCLYKLKLSAHKNRHNIESITENTKAMIPTGDNYDTEKRVLNTELSHALEKSIESIPQDYRMVFILREKEGLSIAETAEALEITEANVKVRLNRAKVMLRTVLENYYEQVPVYAFNLIYCDKIVDRVFAQLQISR